MVWLNSIFLMGQSFIPFPTALMGEYHDNPLAVSFFGGVFAVNTLLFLALHAYIVRNLLKPELAALQDPHGMRKAMIGPAASICTGTDREIVQAPRPPGVRSTAGTCRHALWLAGVAMLAARFRR